MLHVLVAEAGCRLASFCRVFIVTYTSELIYIGSERKLMEVTAAWPILKLIISTRRDALQLARTH